MTEKNLGIVNSNMVAKINGLDFPLNL